MSKKDIKPVELCIAVDDVVKRYPVTEAMEIVRCKTCFFFHSTGFFAVSRPTVANDLQGGALFETLRWYCDYMDEVEAEPEKYSEEERLHRDTYAAMIVNVLSMPLDIFTDTDLMLDISDYILKRRSEYYERLAEEASHEREETLEDAIENANFEGEVLASEAIKEELDALSERANGGIAS